jgi:acyl-CoA synthetase (NDP forming)
MDIEGASRLLDCYGIPIPRWLTAETPDAAAEAAKRLGGPVALKAQGEGLLHKSDMGAVRIGLAADQVAQAAREMDETVEQAGARRDKFIVQEMVCDGVELLIGVADDATFGPVLACGAGGTRAELLKDVSIRVPPITRADARQMVRSLATFPLLTGFRGAAHADIDAIEDQLLRVSAMVEAHNEIAEMDLNPVVARPEGALAVDYRIRLRARPPLRSWPRTWK